MTEAFVAACRLAAIAVVSVGVAYCLCYLALCVVLSWTADVDRAVEEDA